MTESTTQLKRDSYALTREHAVDLDKKDPLRHLRSEFFIPTKADLKRKTLVKYGECLIPLNILSISDFEFLCQHRMVKLQMNHPSTFAGIPWVSNPVALRTE